MLEKYTKDLTELADWYTKTKELTIKVEGLDSKSYIQPLHELRYSYDHLMRAIYYELNADTSIEKIEKAISSAKGHLIRAYSDCIEWLLITVKDEYNRILRPQKMDFTLDEILAVLPEYQEIRSQLQELTDAVSLYKINKRLEESEDLTLMDEFQNPLIKSLSAEDGFFDGKYADLLRKYYDKIHEVEPQFAAMRCRKIACGTIKNILLPILTCVIGGLIVFIITKS